MPDRSGEARHEASVLFHRAVLPVGLLLSALLHACLLLWPSLPTNNTYRKWQEVGLWENTPPGTSGNQKAYQTTGDQNQSSQRPKKASHQQLSLGDLGIAWGTGRSRHLPEHSFYADKPIKEGSGSGESDDGEGGSGGSLRGSLLARSPHTVAYREIYERINTVLEYPVELSSRGIEGDVIVRLVFDQTGKYQRNLSRIVANSDYLRVVVARTFRRAFEEPLPPSYRKYRDKLIIRCLFTFSRRADRGVGIPDAWLMGKELSFRRSFLGEREWRAGPFSAVLGDVPAVGVDPGWFVDKVGELIHPKAKEDPLEHYRRDPEWRRLP